MRKQRERQLGMSLRRGRILETMRQQEATRVFSLIDRMGKQEEAMEAMAEERRRLAEHARSNGGCAGGPWTTSSA